MSSLSSSRTTTRDPLDNTEHSRPTVARDNCVLESNLHTDLQATNSSRPSHSLDDHSLTYLNVARHRLNTWQPREGSSNISTSGLHIARAEGIEALKTVLSGLDVELPNYITEKLAEKYDGMIPMQRLLADEGCWSAFSKRRGKGNDADVKVDIDQ